MANYKNGEVPASALAPLDGQPGTFLRADAAASWNRARKEIKAATGRDIRARGWNRTLAEQVKFFNLAYKPQASGGTDARWWNGRRYVRRPGKAAAAIPGTSNHGWGIAVDVEDFGLENQWNSAWRAKAFPILAKHGWTDHSGRSIGEPWHIEYDPNRDQGKNTAPEPEPIKSRGFLDMLTDAQQDELYEKTMSIWAILVNGSSIGGVKYSGLVEIAGATLNGQSKVPEKVWQFPVHRDGKPVMAIQELANTGTIVRDIDTKVTDDK
jgi:hypothetical protein